MNFEQLLFDYGEPWGYLLILGLTFLEGETVVIIAGILAFKGVLDVNLVLASAFAGTFAGDQFYFAVGRKFGTPLLDKWPHYTKKIDWVFRMLRKYETPFILSFRFIYGVRNVTPFVIGMSEISRLKYFVLNFIAALIWATSFSYGGYYAGEALERFVGEYHWHVLGGVVVLLALVGTFAYVRNSIRVKRAREAAEAEAHLETAEEVVEEDVPTARKDKGEDGAPSGGR